MGFWKKLFGSEKPTTILGGSAPAKPHSGDGGKSPAGPKAKPPGAEKPAKALSVPEPHRNAAEKGDLERSEVLANAIRQGLGKSDFDLLVDRIATRASEGDLKPLEEFGKAFHRARDQERGMTTLHSAASSGDKDRAELLLAKKAEVNAKDNNGLTPLHWASTNGHKDIVGLLLSNGADVNARGDNDLTPLHGAAFQGHKDLVELLLDHGADFNAKTNNGQTPLQLAIDKGHKVVQDLLRLRMK